MSPDLGLPINEKIKYKKEKTNTFNCHYLNQNKIEQLGKRNVMLNIIL